MLRSLVRRWWRERFGPTAGRLVREPTLFEVSSNAWDPDRFGIGSTANPGNPGISFLPIPGDPTTTMERRYTARLCGLYIPPNTSAVVVGLRQYLTIGERITFGDEEGEQGYVLEIPVTTPSWCFADGNVAWSLRFLPLRNKKTSTRRANLPGNFSFNQFETSTSLLVSSETSEAGGYFPPNRGQLPGYPVGGLGNITDIRFPWSGSQMPYRYAVEGPGTLCFYASIWQTDAENREVPVLGVDYNQLALTPEDRFLLQAFNADQAVYRKIGGAIMVETGPSSRPSDRRGADWASRNQPCPVEPGTNNQRYYDDIEDEGEAPWGM